MWRLCEVLFYGFLPKMAIASAKIAEHLEEKFRTPDVDVLECNFSEMYSTHAITFLLTYAP